MKLPDYFCILFQYSPQLHKAREECFGKREERLKLKRDGTIRQHTFRNNQQQIRIPIPVKTMPPQQKDPANLEYQSAKKEEEPMTSDVNSESANSTPPASALALVSETLTNYGNKVKNGIQYTMILASHLNVEEKSACQKCGEMVWSKLPNRLNHINVQLLIL